MGVEKIAVVGAGISGLAAAYKLKKSGHDVTVFEASSSVGGKIATMHHEGFELDLGPVSISETPELKQLITELDLETIEASDASKLRYIYSKGRLHKVGPNILTSSLLSFGSKLSLLKAPFTSKAREGETVADYARRRFGEGVYQRLFDPMMKGIYAGDAELLSATSVIKKRTPRKIISLKGGISSLTNALASKVNVVLNTEVNELSGFDKYYLTTPAFVTEKIIKTPLNVHYSSLSQVYLEVTPGEKKFEGFGFLVPSEERMSLLGAVCVSNIFPSKAPEGKMLFVLFVGSNGYEAKEFNKIIQPAVTRILHVHEWKNAIPQFYVGHEKIIERLKSFDPRIVFGGNYVTGVAVGDCI